jgi:hypothetical protein
MPARVASVHAYVPFGRAIVPSQVTFGVGVRCALPGHRSAAVRFEHAIGQADDPASFGTHVVCGERRSRVLSNPPTNITAFTL